MSLKLEPAQNHLQGPLNAGCWAPPHRTTDSVGQGQVFLTSSERRLLLLLLLVWGPELF